MRRRRAAAIGFAAAAALLLAAVIFMRLAERRATPRPEAPAETGPHPLAEPYLEVAFGNRWGAAPPVLRKRTHPATVRVGGEPRYEDRIHLRRVVAELDGVPGLGLELREWDAGPADLEIQYLSEDLLRQAQPGYDDGYPALYQCPGDAGGALLPGRILLPADEHFPQYMRDNMLLEGIVACLGLAGGLDGHDESAFHDGPNWHATSLTELDRRLLALHHRRELPAGLTRDEAARRLGLAPGPRHD